MIGGQNCVLFVGKVFCFVPGVYLGKCGFLVPINNISDCRERCWYASSSIDLVFGPQIAITAKLCAREPSGVVSAYTFWTKFNDVVRAYISAHRWNGFFKCRHMFYGYICCTTVCACLPNPSIV